MIEGLPSTGPANQLNFDIRDVPNMGDPSFVESKVREMLGEVPKLRAKFTAEQDQTKKHADFQTGVRSLIEHWSSYFRADNAALIQPWGSQEAQDAWLQAHGFGVDDHDAGAPLTALIAHSVNRVLVAANAHAREEIDDSQLRFELDAAIEDCTSMLLGTENSVE